MTTPIVLLTDFGATDPFVGIMKGVIANIAPDTPTIDLTHAIPPGDVQRGAITLWQARPYFPKGTVFLSVVDPGVGTSRRPIILQTRGYTFVGPDNGLFTFVLGKNTQAWELRNPRLILSNPGMTFHGRDIFAPAAGHAARGVPGPEFGPPISDWRLIPVPELDSPSPGIIHGQILHADHFGNLLTSLGRFNPRPDDRLDFRPWVGRAPRRQIDLRHSRLQLPDGKTLPGASTFAQIPEGACAALVGSSGLIEIAANRQSAANLLNLHGGEPVTLVSQPAD